MSFRRWCRLAAANVQINFWISLNVLLATFVGAVGLDRPVQAADLDGVIEPYVVVNVSGPVEGLVERVAVDRGDLVEEGQVLATLESSRERAEVALARFRAEREAAVQTNQARIDFGTRRLSRLEELFRQDAIIPLNDLDEAETSKRLAETGLLEAIEDRFLAALDLRRAEAMLDLRTIRSPITGVVVERFRYSGEYANDQTPILKLAQLDPLRVEVFAPVSMLGKVVVGMQAQVMAEAPSTGAQVARVTVVDRVADAASGTFGVRLELPNPGYRLPAGLKCKVRFLDGPVVSGTRTRTTGLVPSGLSKKTRPKDGNVWVMAAVR